MDPNANLEELRKLIEAYALGNGEIDAADVVRAFELMDALDEWLSKGGFLPKAWERSS